MTIDETNREVLPTCITRSRVTGSRVPGSQVYATVSVTMLAIAVAILTTVATTPCNAQSEELKKKRDALTPEYLIGSAVSLSNKNYPEIEDAIRRFLNNDGLGALEYLKRAEKNYPKLPPANLLMAKIQSLFGNSQAVRLLLDRTVIETPDDPETYLILADQAYRANRTPEADALFRMAEPLVAKFKANSRRKRNFEIRLLAGLAAVAERRGQWDRSYELLTKWVETDPENAIAHARLGMTLFKTDKPKKEALDEFTKARELNTTLAHPHISIAQLFSQEGNVEMARKSFERAYSEEKGNEKTAQAYAEWLILQDELDQAQTVAAALREQSPDSISALFLDGIVAHMQGNTSRSEQALQRVLSLEPRHAMATDLLALLLIESDEVNSRERALSYAENNADHFPNSAQVNITKAWVLYQLGRKAEAQKSLGEGSKAGGLKADSMFLVAKIMVGEGRKEKAIVALKQGIAQRAGLFIFRKQAQELLEKLEGSAGS